MTVSHIAQIRPEYQLRISLTYVRNRSIAIMRIDSRAKGVEWRTVVLDRANTPIDAKVLREWAEILDALLMNGAERFCGIQPSLFDVEASIDE